MLKMLWFRWVMFIYKITKSSYLTELGDGTILKIPPYMMWLAIILNPISFLVKLLHPLIFSLSVDLLIPCFFTLIYASLSTYSVALLSYSNLFSELLPSPSVGPIRHGAA